MNISSSGVSIFTRRAIEKGIKVTLIGRGIWDGPRVATVVWTRQVEENLHQAGLALD